MKSSILTLLAAATQITAFAQGTIVFANRNIPIASGGTTGGGNGNGTYNVPIWEFTGCCGFPGNGAGDLPGGVTVGLFASGAAESATPLAATLLRTDANSQFFATSSQTVTIPGWDAGSTPTLLVRAWQGSGGFAAAKVDRQFGEWVFTTKPLGGTPATGGLPITPPSMTGWGPENGAGLMLYTPEPTTLSLLGLGLAAFCFRRRK